MEDGYTLLSATLQSGMGDAIGPLARKHQGSLQISRGSLTHVQVRLPTDNVQSFVDEVNAAACGRIHWVIR